MSALPIERVWGPAGERWLREGSKILSDLRGDPAPLAGFLTPSEIANLEPIVEEPRVVPFRRLNGLNWSNEPSNEPFEPRSLSDDYEVKPTEWTVSELIPRGQAVLFTGDTKLGKSYLLEHLMICVGLGVPWLCKDVPQISSLGMFCEDPENVLFWRRDQILRQLGAHPHDLEGRPLVYARRGKMNWMMEFEPRSDEGRTTQLWQRMVRYCLDHEITVVVLDTLRQTLGGNDNNPRHITQYFNNCNSFAEQINGNVIIPHHPPKNGLSEYAGTQAIVAGVRTHLHFMLPSHFNRETGEGKGERLLRVIGSNYGSNDVPDIPLRWDSDAQMFLVNPDHVAQHNSRVMDSVERAEFDSRVEQAAAALVLDNGWLVADPASRHSLPHRLKRMAGFHGASVDALQAAADRLVTAGRLERKPVGKGMAAVVLLRPPGLRYANEG